MQNFYLQAGTHLPVPPCDKCVAPAPLQVMTPSGPLAFCRHHGKMYWQQLCRYPTSIIAADLRVAVPDLLWWQRFGTTPCSCSPACRVARPPGYRRQPAS